MENLLQKLHKLQHLSPDEIVAKLSSRIFDRKTFHPWEVPAGLEGRYVLIYYKYDNEWTTPEEADKVWWLAPGAGSTPNREEAVGWPIEVAFARFIANMFLGDDYTVQLHLLEPGHEQIPYQHA